MLKFVGVFLALFALDFVWAKYTHALAAHQAIPASAYASGIILLNGVAVIGYTSDPWLLLPAILGAFAGTYAAIKIGAPCGA